MIHSKKGKNIFGDFHGQEILASVNEALSADLLQSLSPSIYIPITSSSLSLQNIRYILNDILINRRTSIVEFGSGISTIFIANLIKSNKLSCEFYSIDENIEWVQLVTELLGIEGSEQHVKLFHAPTECVDKRDNSKNWYAIDEIEKNLPKSVFFDCAIVDGPTAYTPETAMRRIGAGGFLANRMKNKAAIFLDDVDREGEKQIIKSWNTDYGWEFRALSETMAAHFSGTMLNIK